MFGLSFLSATWWAAKWALAKESVGGASRWANGSSATALGAALVTLILVFALAYGLHTLRADAVAANNAAWQSRAAAQQTARAVRQTAANKRAEDAAARERQILTDQLIIAAERAAALEHELTRLQNESGGDDPIVYPRSLAREMRQ